MFPQCNLNTLALFAFTRFYLRVLADGNGIILRLKRNVILRKAISLSGIKTSSIKFKTLLSKQKMFIFGALLRPYVSYLNPFWVLYGTLKT